ncbi:MAG: efflux RND transporter periplasmic adaptor subunit [Verrucomicrobiales bacterium]
MRFALLAVAAAALAACGRTPEASGPPPKQTAKVRLATVEERVFSDAVEALGTVRAFESIDVSANVTETVTDVSFEDGQAVEKGAVLAQLSNDEELAMLAGARVRLAEQEREVNRLRELADDGAVSQVRLQEYLTAKELALQTIEEVNAKLADRTITAPFAGVLGFRQVSVGALVTPGDVIATLDLVDTVKLDFSVPETFLGDLSPGMEIEAQSDAYPGESFSGKVRDIASRVDPVTRSAVVRAEIPNPDRKLRPGMLLTTRIAKNPAASPAIPERALVSVQAKHFVFAAQQSGGKTVVARTPIRIGRRIPGYVEVVGGLEAGDRIVSDGVIGLRDGAEVAVTGEFEGPAAAYSPASEGQGGEGAAGGEGDGGGPPQPQPEGGR